MVPMTPPGQRPYTAIAVVPTGIGARVGGYAGDALPFVRALASVVDCAIAHPNVLNGAMLSWPLDNVLYVEGYGLDRFAAGDWALRPVHRNTIALVLDRAIEPALQLRQRQAADAARATWGLRLLPEAIVTDEPLGVELRRSPSGASWGTIAQPASLLRAADRAIQAGASAIAVVARFPDEGDGDHAAAEAYRQGKGVDPIAGAEAVISHLIVREFAIPCAHAPALAPWDPSETVDPRAAAEELGHTFLPCVLAGLGRAPQFVMNRDRREPGDLTASAVDAIVVPADACGGGAVLSLPATTERIVVTGNATQMNVPPEALGLAATPVRSYLEAIGAIAVHRAGLDLHTFQHSLHPLH